MKPILQAMAEVEVQGAPSTQGYTHTPLISSETFVSDRFMIRFNQTTGAINYLVDKQTSKIWASPANNLALFSYQTFVEQDYEAFLDQYAFCDWRTTCNYMPDLFGKPNVNSANPVHANWMPTVNSFWKKETTDGLSFLVELTLNPGTKKYGAPTSIWIQSDFGKNGIDMTVYLIGKQATRLPEHSMLTFKFANVEGDQNWMMDKLGVAVSPFDIMVNGNV